MNLSIDNKTYFEKWAEQYKDELLNNVMPFWMKYGWDRKHGGVYTCLNRDGSLMDTTKSVWFQGRFGEGMKLAALALIRNSKIFKIITKGEEWKFEIKEDARFIKDNEKQKCLFWSSEPCKSEDYAGKVTVIIRNITLEEWQNEIDNYL